MRKYQDKAINNVRAFAIYNGINSDMMRNLMSMMTPRIRPSKRLISKRAANLNRAGEFYMFHFLERWFESTYREVKPKNRRENLLVLNKKSRYRALI